MMDSFETIKLPCQGITSSCFPKVTTVYLLVKPILNSSHHSIYQFKFLHFGIFHHCLTLNIQLPTLATNYDDFVTFARPHHLSENFVCHCSISDILEAVREIPFSISLKPNLRWSELFFIFFYRTNLVLDFTVRRFTGTSGA